MMRSLLIIGAYTPLNRGDAAIVAGMRDTARAIDPEIDVRVHTYSTDTHLFRAQLGLEASPGLFAVPVLRTKSRRIRWLIPNLVVAGFVVLAGLAGRRALSLLGRLLPGHAGAALRGMLRADVIMAAGGGYLTDHYSSLLPFLLIEIWTASRSCDTVVLGSQTIGPLARPWATRMVRWALAGVVEIQARDDYTVDTVMRVAPSLIARVRRVADFAFGYSALDPRLVPDGLGGNGRKVVGISVRAWRFPESPDPIASQQAYDDGFAEAITTFLARGWDVVMVATNYPSPGSRDDDVAASEMILSRLPAPTQEMVHLISDHVTTAQLRSIIAACDAFIATRMHASIFAISVGTPTLVLPYEPKGRALMSTLNRPQDVCDIDPVDADELIAGVDRLLDERDRGEMQVRREELDRLTEGTVEAMRRWLG
jgi:polysaccharide pyruvyl transferase WcaK-like protein